MRIARRVQDGGNYQERSAKQQIATLLHELDHLREFTRILRRAQAVVAELDRWFEQAYYGAGARRHKGADPRIAAQEIARELESFLKQWLGKALKLAYDRELVHLDYPEYEESIRIWIRMERRHYTRHPEAKILAAFTTIQEARVWFDAKRQEPLRELNDKMNALKRRWHRP